MNADATVLDLRRHAGLSQCELAELPPRDRIRLLPLTYVLAALRAGPERWSAYRGAFLRTASSAPSLTSLTQPRSTSSLYRPTGLRHAVAPTRRTSARRGHGCDGVPDPRRASGHQRQAPGQSHVHVRTPCCAAIVSRRDVRRLGPPLAQECPEEQPTDSTGHDRADGNGPPHPQLHLHGGLTRADGGQRSNEQPYERPVSSTMHGVGPMRRTPPHDQRHGTGQQHVHDEPGRRGFVRSGKTNKEQDKEQRSRDHGSALHSTPSLAAAASACATHSHDDAKGALGSSSDPAAGAVLPALAAWHPPPGSSPGIGSRRQASAVGPQVYLFAARPRVDPGMAHGW